MRRERVREEDSAAVNVGSLPGGAGLPGLQVAPGKILRLATRLYLSPSAALS